MQSGFAYAFAHKRHELTHIAAHTCADCGAYERILQRSSAHSTAHTGKLLRQPRDNVARPLHSQLFAARHAAARMLPAWCLGSCLVSAIKFASCVPTVAVRYRLCY